VKINPPVLEIVSYKFNDQIDHSFLTVKSHVKILLNNLVEMVRSLRSELEISSEMDCFKKLFNRALNHTIVLYITILDQGKMTEFDASREFDLNLLSLIERQ